MRVVEILFCFSVVFICCTPSNQGNNNELYDFSAVNVEYRVVSLRDSPRRLGINTQFEGINHYSRSLEQLSGFSRQKLISFQYIDAILGKGLNKDQLAIDRYYRFGLNDAELGLVKTTTDFIVPAAMELPESSIMVVFEDDVVLSSDLDVSLRFALKAVPRDWDMLYLGCFQDAYANSNGNVRSPFYPSTKSVEEGYRGNLCPSEHLVPVPGTPWKKMTGGCVAGTWAYGLRAESAQRLGSLLKSFLPIEGRFPIDEMYRILVSRGQINAYCLSPELVRPNYTIPSTIH